MTGVERRSFALRLSVFFAALFAGYGVNVPYLPLWLDARGLGATEISLVLALPAIVRIATTPALAFLADRHRAHRGMLAGAGGVAALATAMLAMSYGFWPILAVAIVTGAATAALLPLSETVAMRGVRDANLDYGRMRLWGSVTFVVGSVAGGFMIGRLGTEAIVWAMAACALATLLAAMALPGAGAADPGVVQRLRVADAMTLAIWPPFLWFLAAGSAVQAAHALIYAFGSLHWRVQGVGPGWIGTLWAIGVVVEIALFACSNAATRRFGPLRLLTGAAVAALVRWVVMAADPPLSALVPLQMLHGLTFGAAHIGAMYFISRAVSPDQAATAQAIYATAVGTTMAVMTLLAGGLYARLGGTAYLAMALLATAGVVASLRLAATWDGQVFAGRRSAP